jgi:hypothetical protein
VLRALAGWRRRSTAVDPSSGTRRVGSCCLNGQCRKQIIRILFYVHPMIWRRFGSSQRLHFIYTASQLFILQLFSVSSASLVVWFPSSFEPWLTSTPPHILLANSLPTTDIPTPPPLSNSILRSTAARIQANTPAIRPLAVQTMFMICQVLQSSPRTSGIQHQNQRTGLRRRF